ncbi:hypothetical protein [Umezakia ovalisporum]|jgi:hypothetical protein|uniref:Uncharacterized protein n=2 Tax=Umezakia ovalisporum TaxID=75695 RepID=A0AA43KD93_9CYAN|nr:hypothetical protein [Umezakia ovalisporum]MBI1241830.1 hypothetical protein [Nostoc sp. RI_552]MDH6056405.1 hypothetical protein [Umezakia ovalisporum FSS-43]MDH6062231.1 hypothetical protein [Umezakia ovalisporum FSS-62]MDH6068105.1 hypothetical protein [Umezakia ovalisporum APH033B]MDH6072715.1 hypothetical protein [Umezakia ovalisporum CobakiLakeA]
MPKLSPKSFSKQWLTVVYQPVSLFSLKRSDATSMAGRSNLVPTPYAIKMALLRVLLETQGREHQSDFIQWIDSEFTWIRDLTIYIWPPEKLVVNRNGYKLRYYDQNADKVDKNRVTIPMQGGFVFREWVYMQGNLQICCSAGNYLGELEGLFGQINYFGKRGCFFQHLPEYGQVTPEATFNPNPSNGFTVQPMDDLSEKTTFNRINPFSQDKAQLDKDRVIKPGFLPLQFMATSSSYDVYQRY